MLVRVSCFVSPRNGEAPLRLEDGHGAQRPLHSPHRHAAACATPPGLPRTPAPSLPPHGTEPSRPASDGDSNERAEVSKEARNTSPKCSAIRGHTDNPQGNPGRVRPHTVRAQPERPHKDIVGLPDEPRWGGPHPRPLGLWARGTVTDREEYSSGGTRGARSVRRLTLDFSSGHDLTVVRRSLGWGLCTDRWNSGSSLPVSPCPSGARALSPSLRVNLTTTTKRCQRHGKTGEGHRNRTGFVAVLKV